MATLRDLLYTALFTCAVLGALLLGSAFAIFGVSLMVWAAGVVGAYRWAEGAHARRLQAQTTTPQPVPESEDQAAEGVAHEASDAEEQRLIA